MLALAAVAGAWVWIGGTTPEPDENGAGPPDVASDAVPVVVRPVAVVEDRVRIEAVGSGEALQAVTVFPAVAGEVVEVAFAAGDRVTAGTTLVRLNDRAQRLAVSLARLQLQDARSTLDRYERTGRTGAVSAHDIDAARTAVGEAEVVLAQAELDLRDRTVRAAFDGVVGLAQVDEGDRVTDATPLTTLDDRTALLVDFEVPEAHAARIAVGQPIEATTWMHAGRTFEGTVDAVDSRLDPAARTLGVRARVPNDDDSLRPGMSFAVQLGLDGTRHPSVLETAVQWGREGSHVWRIRDDRAERLAVRVIRRTDGRVLVDAALDAGDLVAVEGVQRLRDGRPVVYDMPPPSPARPAVGES